jgi:hypothetical protein
MSTIYELIVSKGNKDMESILWIFCRNDFEKRRNIAIIAMLFTLTLLSLSLHKLLQLLIQALNCTM